MRRQLCVGGHLMSTALLPPPVGPPRRRWRWGRLAVPGRPCCSRGTSHFCGGVSAAGFVTWVGSFLAVAHVVSKCLLVARELESELGVSSEPPTELIPFLLGVVKRAILVVWTICHLRSERVSFAVILFKSMCGHTCLQGVANNCSWRCKIMETQRYAKPVAYPRKHSKLALFFARRQKFCRQNDPRFGVHFWTPKRGPSCPDTSKSN